jgi:hypothetical protein
VGGARVRLLLPPAEAIQSSQFHSHVRFPGQIAGGGARGLTFRRAPSFCNATDCGNATGNVCDPSLVHIAITLDEGYLRGSVAAVHSVVQHAVCPESVFFHFLCWPSPDTPSTVRRPTTSSGDTSRTYT